MKKRHVFYLFAIIAFFCVAACSFDKSKLLNGYEVSQNSACIIENTDTTDLINPVRLTYGTGTFVNTRIHPYIITCGHIIKLSNKERAKQVIVRTYRYKVDRTDVFEKKAKVIAYGKDLDVAFLEVEDAPNFVTFTKWAKTESKVSSEVYYFGADRYLLLPLFHKGTLSGRNLLSPQDHQIYDTVHLGGTQGNSGSCVFNKEGLGCGILCLAFTDTPQMGICPMREIRKRLRESNNLDLEAIMDGKYENTISKMYQKTIEF